jgi:hypothetical protein
MRVLVLLSLSVASLASVTALGCDAVLGKKAQPEEELPRPPPEPEPEPPVPPVQNATPVEAFADASFDPEGKSPFEQAQGYEASGQLWVARLLIEKKALSPEGTKAEAELLARICEAQGDAACLADCGAKLGRKIKLTGAPQGEATASPQGEDTSDLGRARELFKKKQLGPARKILEPKVLGPDPEPGEVVLLRTICAAQKDRVCVALCDAKLK